MGRFSRFILLVRLLLVAGRLTVPTVLEAFAPTGTGEFVFADATGGRDVTVFYVKAESYRRGDPPVIVLHGMNRNADDYRDAWIGHAQRYGLFVVVPLFSQEEFPGTEGYNLGNFFRSETDRAPNLETKWSYHVPRVVFDFLCSAGGDTDAPGYMVFGHSAGAQFVHRMIAFAPDSRLLLAIVANAGWYTFPNLRDDWPYGFAGTALGEDDLPSFLAANLTILLGDQDTDPAHDSLRRTPEAMRQGAHRFERGHSFLQAGQEQADRMHVEFGWRLQVVPGVAHDQAGMAPAAAELMAETIRRIRAGEASFQGNDRATSGAGHHRIHGFSDCRHARRQWLDELKSRTEARCRSGADQR